MPIPPPPILDIEKREDGVSQRAELGAEALWLPVFLGALSDNRTEWVRRMAKRKIQFLHKPT
jgi:hypothetical protein